MNRVQSNSSAAKLEKVGADSLCGGRMWLDMYVCVPHSRALLSTLWLQIKLYSRSPQSKACDCLFCLYTDGSIKRTLAELQWGDGLHWQTSCLAQREGLVITCDTQQWIRPTSSSVFLTHRCRLNRELCPASTNQARGQLFCWKKLFLTAKGCWSEVVQLSTWLLSDPLSREQLVPVHRFVWH